MNDIDRTLREFRSDQPGPQTGAAARIARQATVAPHRAPRWRRMRVLAPAVGGLTAAALAVGLVAGGLPGSGPLAVDRAEAAPLVRLTNAVLAEPVPGGDATLVLRTHSFAVGKGFTGADLHLDNGQYFSAPTRAGLRNRIANGRAETEASGRVIAAVAAAALNDVSVDEARAEVIRASFLPHAVVPAAKQAPPVSVDGAEAKAASLTDRQIDDNRIWFSSIDALVAGAGRRDVRAGALRLLASIASVDVSEVSYEGRAALRVRSTDFSGGYEERLLIDAKTGIPLRFEGGSASEAPSVVVTYDVSRTTVAAIAE